jgi:hypothetical protein
MKLIVQGTPGEPSKMCCRLLILTKRYRGGLQSGTSASAGLLHHSRRHLIRVGPEYKATTIRSPKRRSDHLLPYTTLQACELSGWRSICRLIPSTATTRNTSRVMSRIRRPEECDAVWHNLEAGASIRHDRCCCTIRREPTGRESGPVEYCGRWKEADRERHLLELLPMDQQRQLRGQRRCFHDV